MIELSPEAIGSLATAAATIVLVVLLYRTVKQFEATVEVSRIQTEYRFRPWIGHVGAIEKMNDSINGDCQFSITVRNFGELPSSGVTAKSAYFTHLPKREDLKKTEMTTFNLGPMLPNMDKHYWFFIPSERWKKIASGEEKIFTMLYFEYTNSGSKSGYGMISEYSPEGHNFIHRDMWIDDSKLDR